MVRNTGVDGVGFSKLETSDIVRNPIIADIVHRLKREGYRISTTMMTHKNMNTGKVSNFAKYTYEDVVDIGSNYELTLG